MTTHFLEWIPNQDLDWYTGRNVLFALHHSQVEESIARIWSMSSDYHPDLLITHNGFEFDLPFLMQRWNNYKISHPFLKGYKEKIITASSFRGKPIKFVPVYWANTQIIDTF